MRTAKATAAEAAFIQDADEVDDHVLAAKVFAQLGFVVDVAVLQGESGQYEQVLVPFTVAGKNGDPVPIPDQARHQARAQEPGAAKNAYG